MPRPQPRLALAEEETTEGFAFPLAPCSSSDRPHSMLASATCQAGRALAVAGRAALAAALPSRAYSTVLSSDGNSLTCEASGARLWPLPLPTSRAAAAAAA